MLLITIDANNNINILPHSDEWIDPSIVKYTDEEDLILALLH